MLRAAKTVFKFCQKFMYIGQAIGNTGYGVSSLCLKRGYDLTKTIKIRSGKSKLSQKFYKKQGPPVLSFFFQILQA